MLFCQYTRIAHIYCLFGAMALGFGYVAVRFTVNRAIASLSIRRIAMFGKLRMEVHGRTQELFAQRRELGRSAGFSRMLRIFTDLGRLTTFSEGESVREVPDLFVVLYLSHRSEEAQDFALNVLKADRVECEFALCGPETMDAKPGEAEHFRMRVRCFSKAGKHPIGVCFTVRIKLDGSFLSSSLWHDE